MLYSQESKEEILQPSSSSKIIEDKIIENNDQENDPNKLIEYESNSLCHSESINAKENYNSNKPLQQENEDENNKHENILENISNVQSNNQNCLSNSNTTLSSILLVSCDQSGFGSLFNICRELENLEILREIEKKLIERFIPFFVKIKGYEPQFIYAKKDANFIGVIRGIKEKLNIEDDLGNFYKNNHLIDCYQTIEELQINILDKNITNYYE